MTKGQRAMVVAKIYPEPEQGKRVTSFATKEVAAASLSQARTVLRYSIDDDLADNVLAGAGPCGFEPVARRSPLLGASKKRGLF